MPKRTKAKQKTAKRPKKRAPQAKKSGGLLSSIGEAASALAPLASMAMPFLGMPVGAGTRMGKRGGRLSNTTTSQLVQAPAQLGLSLRTPNWDFNKAPDVGMGPGVRISGRIILGQVCAGMTWNAIAPDSPPVESFRYYGLGQTGGNVAIGGTGDMTPQQLPQNFVVFNPVSTFSGLIESEGGPLSSPFGAYTSGDNPMQEIAKVFTRYKLVDATVTYAPSVGTEDAHSVTIAWLNDPGVALEQIGVNNDYGGTDADPSYGSQALMDIDWAMAIPNSCTFPSWGPASLVIPVDKKEKELLFVNDTSLSDVDLTWENASLSEASLEARQLFPGAFVVTGFGQDSATQQAESTFVLGTLFCDMTVDLYQIAAGTVPDLATGYRGGGTLRETPTTKLKKAVLPQIMVPQSRVKKLSNTDVWYFNYLKQRRIKRAYQAAMRKIQTDEYFAQAKKDQFTVLENLELQRVLKNAQLKTEEKKDDKNSDTKSTTSVPPTPVRKGWL